MWNRGSDVSRIKNNKGLTLIEIIITLAVMGIVVMPLVSMFITSQRINNESQMKYDAVQIAQKHIEDIKSSAISGMGQLSSKYPSIGEDKFGKEFVEDGYLVNVTIEKGDSFIISDVELIDIPESFHREFTVSDTNEYLISIDDEFTKNVKVTLNLPDNSVAKLKILNDYDNVKFYIFKRHNSVRYTVSGNGTIIEADESIEKPDNLLYNILVDVSKNGKHIDRIKGTAVFRFKPY